MTDKELRARFEKLLWSASVHQWSNETLEHVRVLISSEKTEQKDLLLVIAQAILSEISRAKEEYVVALVIAAKAGMDYEQVLECATGTLFQKIHHRDFHFIVDTLFPDKLPLPEDLIYDITARIIFDIRDRYDRIAEAFKRVPKKNADQAVLFLTFQLCRADLNLQNRDLLFLILSRLDLALPEKLASIANENLERIKHSLSKAATNNLQLIRLSEREEAVGYDKASSSENEPAQTREAGEPSPPRALETASTRSPDNDKAPKRRPPAQKKVAAAETASAPATFAAASGPAPRTVSKTAAKAKRPVSIQAPGLAAGINENAPQPPETARGLEFPTSPKKPVRGTEAPAKPAQPTAPRPADVITVRAPVARPKTAEAEKLLDISSRKRQEDSPSPGRRSAPRADADEVTDETMGIEIGTFDEIFIEKKKPTSRADTAAQPKTEQKTAPASQPQEQGANAPNKVQPAGTMPSGVQDSAQEQPGTPAVPLPNFSNGDRKKSSRIVLWGLIAFAIVVVVVIYAVSRTGGTVMVEQAPVAGEVTDNAAMAGTAVIAATGDTISTTTVSMAPDAPIEIVNQGNESFWIPAPGQNLWVLYSALTTEEQILPSNFDRIEALSVFGNDLLDWIAFQSNISTLNPNITDINRIEAGTRIKLR